MSICVAHIWLLFAVGRAFGREGRKGDVGVVVVSSLQRVLLPLALALYQASWACTQMPSAFDYGEDSDDGGRDRRRLDAFCFSRGLAKNNRHPLADYDVILFPSEGGEVGGPKDIFSTCARKSPAMVHSRETRQDKTSSCDSVGLHFLTW